MFAHAQTAGLFSHEISCRDPYVEPFLDRGSIPLTSTKSTLLELLWLKNLSRSSKLTYSWNYLWYKDHIQRFW